MLRTVVCGFLFSLLMYYIGCDFSRLNSAKELEEMSKVSDFGISCNPSFLHKDEVID